MRFSQITGAVLAGVLLLPTSVFAATLSLDPAVGTYGPGDTFIETIRIDNEGDCINAANVALTYPKDTLRAVDFSRGDSIFSLWAVEPTINTDQGTVTFAGGIPGGYCGRIVGDAGLSNVLGKVVFTVVAAGSKNATVGFSPASQVYLNDGAGTLATLTTKSSVITLSPTPTLKDNQWLTEVGQDTTPPQPFVVQVESTSGVFDGQYYAVFSTTDKESGLDHFEIHEGNGWKHVTSPYQLKNQSLLGVGDIQIRAVDKAGNMRMGEYSASKTPKRLLTYKDWLPFILFGIIVLIGAIVWYFDHKKARSMHPPTA